MENTERSEMPKVSICIPTFNRHEGLAHTLERATSQNYKNLEILVSDNATENKDGVATVINRYNGDERVKYYRHPVNKGPVDNYNYLISWASGEYIIFMPDDDDYFDQNLVSHGVKALIENPEASVAQGNIYYLEDGKAFSMDRPPYDLNCNRYERIKHNITHICTGHLMYGLLRSRCIKNFVLNKRRPSEGYLILHLLNEGPFIDAPDMQYNNTYTWHNEEYTKGMLAGKLHAIDDSVFYIKALLKTKVSILEKFNLVIWYLLLRFPLVSYAPKFIYELFVIRRNTEVVYSQPFKSRVRKYEV